MAVALPVAGDLPADLPDAADLASGLSAVGQPALDDGPADDDAPSDDDAPPEDEPPYDPDETFAPDSTVTDASPATRSSAPVASRAAAPAATATRSVAFQEPQRYGESVVREILNATFVEEQPAPRGQTR